MFKNRQTPLVPHNIRDLNPYVPGKTIEEVKQEYQPDRISKLASNENRLGCSPKVRDAILKDFTEIQDYPDPISGVLREKIADRNGVEPDNILVAAGSESIIAILCRTFFLNHEQAVTADATFVGFFVHASIRGIDIKKVPVTDSYGFDLDAIARSVTDRTKMIYIANPNNPTGTYITKSEFESFMNRVPDHVLVIMDEAYFEFAEEVEDYPNSLDYSFDNVITLRTFSKAYGLAGIRIGYAIAHEELISELSKTKLTFEPTTLAQAAARAALDDTDFLQHSKEVVAEGRQRLYDFFDSHGISYVPSISNAVMMILPDEEQAKAFTQGMMEQGVILRRVAGFGLPNCIRVTVGTGKEIDHFIESFEQVSGLISQHQS